MAGMKKEKSMGRQEALLYAAGLCARCEQCESDVRRKLAAKGTVAADIQAVVDYLYEHRYLDEGRFARAYVRDKHRFNGWGRIKLRMMLSALGMGREAVAAALSELTDVEYMATLGRLVEREARGHDLTAPAEREKAVRRLYGRGFEPELARRAIERHIKGEG